ncbi:sensor histidine kinase KdpD [Pedobacter sp. SYP-B3415]|uniref:sensor histidine kinase n=1 Tax=Pedobacter sp. SYP-B3415 TaxID=2496641 RepID=UPI00101E1FE6|nr:HAMP domain-containing sensor histidine kinase [Pedobacter sp. SYP-B3415]
MQIRSAISQFWSRLVGSPETFALNERIFHSVCIVAMMALIYNIPFNYAIGLPDISALCIAILGVLTFFYYLSRFRQKSTLSIFVCCALGSLLFAVNFFLNSGLSGPTDLFFLALIVLTISVANSRQYHFWVPFNIVLMVGLSLVEYYRPDLVPGTYDSTEERFIDINSAFLITALLVYISLGIIRQSYNRARQEAEDRTREILVQHAAILAQKQELEVVNSEKNKLMSVIAHDLRAPITNLQSYLELLAQGFIDEQEKKVFESELLQNTKDTGLLLSSLLLWSKSQMEGLKVSLKSIRLREHMGHWLEVDKSIAAKKNIQFEYDIDGSLQVIADEAMLMTVIRNLSGNAIKFTPPGGYVKVAAREEQGEILISVADDGPGITRERQKKVFSMAIESMSGTANEKGSGLGLALCRDFSERQGGRIWFSSSQTEGTVFTLALPAGTHQDMQMEASAGYSEKS